MWEGCLGGQSILCKQACDISAWGKPPCQVGCRCASSHLRLIAVCSVKQSILCKQACARNCSLRPGENAMPSGMPLRCIPLAADRRMSIQPGVLLQASLRQNSRLNGRMAVFETKFDKGLCRLAQKRYNCLERHVFFCGYARTELEEICQTIF